MERPTSIPDEFEDHAKLMSDLMVIAFQTDMTRVITFMMAREGSNRSYRSIGVSDGHHSVTHHQNDPEKIAKTMKIDELHVALLRVSSGPSEGDTGWRWHAAGPLDDPLRQQHLRRQCPHASRPAAGACRRQAAASEGGQHPLAPETPMNNLLLTMLERAGVRSETLGDSTGRLQLPSGA